MNTDAVGLTRFVLFIAPVVVATLLFCVGRAEAQDADARFADTFEGDRTGEFQARGPWAVTADSGTVQIIDMPSQGFRPSEQRSSQKAVELQLDRRNTMPGDVIELAYQPQSPLTGKIAFRFFVRHERTGRSIRTFGLIGASGERVELADLAHYGNFFSPAVQNWTNVGTGAAAAQVGHTGQEPDFIKVLVVVDPTAAKDNVTVALERVGRFGDDLNHFAVTGTYDFSKLTSSAAPPVAGFYFALASKDDGRGSFFTIDDFAVLDGDAVTVKADGLPESGTRVPSAMSLEVKNQEAAQILEGFDDAEQKRLAALGVIDVTLPPYNVDATGTHDVTKPLQQALDDAWYAGCVAYLPAGTYLVSDTLQMAQPAVSSPREEGRSHGPQFVENSYPHALRGYGGPDGRAVIRLAPASAKFADTSDPTPVIHAFRYGNHNIHYNQSIIDIDVEIGEGNPGAVGVSTRGAQYTALESVTVRAGDGFAGVYELVGSGGGQHDITVVGGRYGVYGIRSQPAPTLSNVTLIGQQEAAIYYSGRGALSVVGAWIEGAPVVGEGNPGRAFDGQMAFTDSVLKLDADRPAFSSDRSIYLNNVYVHNAATIAEVDGKYRIEGNPEGWAHVKEYVGASTERHSAKVDDSELIEDVVMVDRRTLPGTYANVVAPSHAPPADIQSRHSWGKAFPYWNDPEIANVKDPPYGAKGDGVTDDTDAIQRAIDENQKVLIPVGEFMISRPLRMKKHTKLIGISGFYSMISPMGESFEGYTSAPLIETEDAADATAVLAHVRLNVVRFQNSDPFYALHWRAGRDSVVRGVFFDRTLGPIDIPNVVVDGSGGGRWYNHMVFAGGGGKNFRGLLVRDTTEPMSIYHLNIEFGQCDAHSEFINARNVSIFGFKSEGGSTKVNLVGCRDFRLIGYGGNAKARTTLFRAQDSEDFLFAAITHELHGAGDPDFDTFTEVLDGEPIVVDGRHQLALYKVGQPQFDTLYGSAPGTGQRDAAAGARTDSAPRP